MTGSPTLKFVRVSSSFRAGRHRDFGPSRFGKRTDKEGRARFPTYEGRNVDLFAYAIPAKRTADRAAAVQAWLRAAPTDSAKLLAEKAVVMVEPERLEIIWPVEAEGRKLTRLSQPCQYRLTIAQPLAPASTAGWQVAGDARQSTSWPMCCVTTAVVRIGSLPSSSQAMWARK
jgi:hypothetical protein